MHAKRIAITVAVLATTLAAAGVAAGDGIESPQAPKPIRLVVPGDSVRRTTGPQSTGPDVVVTPWFQVDGRDMDVYQRETRCTGSAYGHGVVIRLNVCSRHVIRVKVANARMRQVRVVVRMIPDGYDR